MAEEVIVVLEAIETVVVTEIIEQVTISFPGPQGPPGPTGPQGDPGTSGARYDFVQVAPASTWVVNHNLGFYPNVSVIISDEVWDADITHNTINQVSIVHASPQSGKAEFS